MSNYSDAYSFGTASGSSAYRYAGDILPSRGASILGFGSHAEGEIQGNSLGLLGRGSAYSYDLTFHQNSNPNGSGRLLPLLAPLREPHGWSLLRDGGGGGGARVSAEADLFGEMHESELRSWAFPAIDFHRLERDEKALNGPNLYSRGPSSSLLPARADVPPYDRISDAYVGSTYDGQLAERMPAIPSQGSVRKRKTPSLDEIIKETWELHSLFRAGLAAASNTTESSTEYSMPSRKRAKVNPTMSNMSDTRRNSVGTSLQKEASSDWTRHLDSSGLFETDNSWKELDFLGKKTRGKVSSNKHEESSPRMNEEQEKHASDLQRCTSEKVMEFMGNDSDDGSSDYDSFLDSDDDVPNVMADSSGDAKSREERAYEFFLQTIAESKELQKLYNEQCHVGKFQCLVCSSIPGKPTKQYNGLISVIMHASKILKTKKKQEHRGYARALCAAMGWDICRLPSTTHSSSPHPRCCIPSKKEENEDAKKTDKMTEESESDNSGKGLDSTGEARAKND